jgi:SAM-dependent methyltransferase
VILDQYKPICEVEAQKLGVSPAVHPEDFIFHFLLNLPLFRHDARDAIAYYFQNGFDSAQKLRQILTTICRFDGGQRIQLLEFAAGYGCVTRHFRNVIPFVQTSACDIHPQAMRFIEETFGIAAALSSSQPEDLILEQNFDAIFALSFFSHMPKSSFSRWLKRLASFLRPGGYLIFTTHGIESTSLISECRFDPDGFFFRSTSEQRDLDVEEYGTACTLPTYVIRQIFDQSNWALIFFQQGYWWTHQDLYVVKCLDGS